MARAVQRGMIRRTNLNTTELLVDETSFKKGHDYVTLLSNRQGQVIAVTDGHSASSLEACFQSISDPLTTRSICMDMSKAYLSATHRYFGERAEKLIAIDHFHIAKRLTQAVEEVRRSESNSLLSSLRLESFRARYGWLKRNENLQGNLRTRVSQLAKLMINTGLSWIFKEQARAIWYSCCDSRAKAKAAWKDWLGLVNVSGIKPMITAGSCIHEHLNGIINAMRMRASNGLAEAINGNIQRMKVRAMGYRNKERFKTAIMFHFGKLDMAFHQER